MSQFSITSQQLAKIESYSCLRLSSDPANVGRTSRFCSAKGQGLVETLQKYGWAEDVTGKNAFYLVNDSTGKTVMFFSLKCGLLFSPFTKNDVLSFKRELEKIDIILAKDFSSVTPEEFESIVQYLNKFQITGGYDFDSMKEHSHNIKIMLSNLKNDFEIEQKNPVHRVGITIPGVELVQFCVDDSAKKEWKSHNIPRTLGETLFWQYIVPKFYEVQAIVGCEYAYLYAADMSPTRDLITYYETSLGFEQKEEFGMNKPVYDFSCKFMCQTINGLSQKKQKFFDNFNAPAY